MKTQQIRQQLNRLYRSDRPEWEKWEALDEIAKHATALADSILDDDYCFDDDTILEPVIISIFEDR